ncbi:MAG TPA: Ig-like domain-containing protein [Promineifilum sp.]|nr:Ig-like domain-containing protein [Promineifilum sp.]
MKRSATATILFLLMLLLAAAAGFVFLLLGGVRLRDEARGIRTDNDSLRAQVAAAELQLSSEVATRESTVAALATAEHESVLLEGQLVDSQQTVDELTARADDLSAEAEDLRAELAQAQEASQDKLPVARIVTPEDGATLPIGQPVEIVLVAADSDGLVSLTLEVDGERYTEYPLGGETLYARTLTWDAPAEEGEHTFAVMATNLNGNDSEPQTVAIQLQDTEARNAAIRAEVEANVEALRGLSLLTPITPTVLTRDQLRDRLAAENAAEVTPDEARDDTLELSAFDFIEPDYDLYGVLLGLQSEGILGFYDPEAAEFVVVNDGALLDAPAQWTHAHEFVHALQDQHYDLDALTDDSLDSEARAAVRALAEGEAELVQFLYLTQGNYFSEAEVNEILADMEQSSDTLPEDVPPILISNLAFPYDSGSRFVDALYRAGGFEAIDAAWANPPRSTEQILHPERYLAGDTPELVSLAPLTDTLGAGWQQVAGDIMGEFFLRQYLDQQLPATVAERAAMGWGGDRYAVYWNEATGELVLALRLVWDTATDAAEFADAYADYPRGLLGVEPQAQADGSTCWLRGEAICFLQAEGESWIVRAPDVATAGAVLAALVG